MLINANAKAPLKTNTKDTNKKSDWRSLLSVLSKPNPNPVHSSEQAEERHYPCQSVTHAAT